MKDCLNQEETKDTVKYEEKKKDANVRDGIE